MIIKILAYCVFFLLTPLRLLCGFFLNPGASKVQIFLSERRSKFFEQRLKDASSKLKEVEAIHNCVVYWIHVASAGELEQAIPILSTLHNRHSTYFFITYFSPSTKAFLKNCPGLLGATSLPLENPKFYRAIINDLNIRRLLLVRYDFWPMLIHTAQSAKVPIGIIAATLKKARSPLPRKLQMKLRSLWFQTADLIFLVSEDEKIYLEKINFPKEKLLVSGDAKWQRAKERAKNAVSKKQDTESSAFSKIFSTVKSKSAFRVLVFGSPHKEEIHILERCAANFKQHHIVFVAPAEIDERSLKSIEDRLKSTNAIVLRFSQEPLDSMVLKLLQSDKPKIIIIDSFGYLAELYQFADLAIVGGGFDGQLHNVLEPAAYPVVTLYGNNASRASEAITLLRNKAALGFSTPQELFQFLNLWSSIDGEGCKTSEEVLNLQTVLDNARRLFGSLPDSSEVVCRALAQQDRLETI